MFANASVTYENNAVALTGTTKNTVICRNQFYSVDTGITLGVDTTNNQYDDNQYYIVAVARVSDLGLNIRSPGQFTRLAKTTVQSVADDTLTPVVFEQLIVDTMGGADLVSDDTIVTIPARVFNVSIEAGIAWADNSTGVRTVVIYVNGSASTLLPPQVYPAAESSSKNVYYGNISVNTDDEISVMVKQTSGGALNLAGDFRSYLKIIVLPRVF